MASILVYLVFGFFAAWWVLLRLNKAPSSLSGDSFSDTYGVAALIGGLIGLRIAKDWGGFKSQMGKALSFFSFGLLAQAFGQLVYSMYFFFLHRDIPYPSLGDIGYFGSVLLYIYAIYTMLKITGAHLNVGTIGKRLFVLVIPLALLVTSYYIFLRGYTYSSPLASFLDFGYPFGEAIYISIAIITFALSRKLLGGIMRGRLLFLLFALLIQYIADFSFLYQDSRNTWTAGGINDFIYLVAYFLMGLALLNIAGAYREIRTGDD